MTYIINPITSTKSTENSTTADVGGSNTLSTTLTAGETTSVVLTDSSMFPSAGTIKIGDEYITYSGNASETETLTITERGAFNTTAVEHTSGAAVIGVFIGTSVLNNQPDVMVVLKSDTAGTKYLDFSDDNSTWYASPINGYKITANLTSTKIKIKSYRYFRIRFENSSSSKTTDFSINTYFGVFQQSLTNNNGELKVADSNIPNLTQFGEMSTVSRTQIIELKSTYGLSNIRDVVTKSGSGDVTNTIGSDVEYLLTTGGTTNSYSVLNSAERGRYAPGFTGEIGIGIRIPTSPVNNQIGYWGLFEVDDSNPPVIQNGFYFSQNATNIYVNIARNGTSTNIAQSSWNADKLDGTDESGITLDLSRGNIFQIDFTWYGYGTVEYIVNLPNPVTFFNERIVIHRYRPNGETSVLNPNLPISAYVYNGASGGNYDLYVAGRQYSIIGKYLPNRRTTSQYRRITGLGTSFEPLVTAKRKDSYKSVSVKIEGIDIISGDDLIIQIRTGVTGLTGVSYVTPDDTSAGETALEIDKSASAVSASSGEMLWSGLIAGGSGKNNILSQNEFEFDLIGTQNISVIAKTIDGTNVTVDCIIRFKEEW